MKNISLLSLLVGLATTTAQAQEVVIDTSYYTPPVRKRVLMEDPEKNSRPDRTGKRAASKLDFINELKEVQTWYVGAEGGFRSDVSTLSNTFQGLISNNTQTKATWGLALGYTYRNAWAIETGYTHAPTHLNLTVANGNNPFVFTYPNSGFGIPFRIKRRLGSGKKAKNGTGFWLTAGAWLTPNGSGQIGDFKLIGFSYYNRNRMIDTVRINNTATVVNRITGIAEVGTDYSVRLSPYLELGFYLRKYWGLGTALRSDLAYTVNNTLLQQSLATANGSGWGFGMSFRYIYSRQHEIKKP